MPKVKEVQAPTAASEETPAPASNEAASDSQDGQVLDPAAVMAEASPELLDAVWNAWPSEDRERRQEPEIERRAQSRSDKSDSATKLEQDIRDITEKAGVRSDSIWSAYDDHPDREAIMAKAQEDRKVAIDMADAIYQRRWVNNIRTNAHFSGMRDEVEQAFTSTRDQGSEVELRVVMQAVTEGHQRIGASKATGKASEEAKAQGEDAKKLIDLIQTAKVAGMQTSSTQIAAGLKQLTYAELAGRYGSGTATPEEADEYLRQRAERKR